MKRDTDGPLAHAKALRGLLNRTTLDRYGFHQIPLALAELLEQSIEITTIHGVIVVCGDQQIGQIVDRHRLPVPSPAKGVDDLIAGDGHDPGPDGPIDVPTLPFEMDRNENFLNDILGVALIKTGVAALPARRRSQDGRERGEEAMIRLSVPSERGAHQRGPFLLTPSLPYEGSRFEACHACAPPVAKTGDRRMPAASKSDADGVGLISDS
jgi:hypothetical protein